MHKIKHIHYGKYTVYTVFTKSIYTLFAVVNVFYIHTVKKYIHFYLSTSKVKKYVIIVVLQGLFFLLVNTNNRCFSEQRQLEPHLPRYDIGLQQLLAPILMDYQQTFLSIQQQVELDLEHVIGLQGIQKAYLDIQQGFIQNFPVMLEEEEEEVCLQELRGVIQEQLFLQNEGEGTTQRIETSIGQLEGMLPAITQLQQVLGTLGTIPVEALRQHISSSQTKYNSLLFIKELLENEQLLIIHEGQLMQGIVEKYQLGQPTPVLDTTKRREGYYAASLRPFSHEELSEEHEEMDVDPEEPFQGTPILLQPPPLGKQHKRSVDQVEEQEEAIASSSGTVLSLPYSPSCPPLEGESSEEEESREEPVTKKRKVYASDRYSGPGSPGASPGGLSLIPGYALEEHLCSLQGVQCILLPIVEQIATSLKTLTIHMQASSPKQYTHVLHSPLSHTAFFSQVNDHSHTKRTYTSVSPLGSRLRRYDFFGDVDMYIYDSEKKVRSGQANVVIYPHSRLTMGVRYTYNTNAGSYADGMTPPQGLLTNAKTYMNALVTGIAWNSHEEGFSGKLAACYGRGQMKNTRCTAYAGEERGSKGYPALQQKGALVQVGYTIFVSKNACVTPYIEHISAVASWRSYDEHTSSVACRIRDHTDRIRENSIGIRGQYTFSYDSQVQLWLSSIVKKHTTGALECTPIVPSARVYHEMVLPGFQKRSSRRELGLDYRVSIADTCTMHVHAMLPLHKTHGSYTPVIRCLFRYTY